jgi:hypothetical protein
MKRDMRCTLLIPHLFWPHENAQTVWSELQLPGLEKLIGRAHAERFEAITPEGWLCQAFELERQQDWPVAPLTLELDGGEAADAYWLRADPVHLRMDRDRIVLVENELFGVSMDEAKALGAALNDHFRTQEIAFHAPRPKRWYVRLPHAPSLVTHSASEAAGRDVRSFLPSGGDALTWHQVFNEIQMLLYDHPVNVEREQRGEPVVNSVWFWGGGVKASVRGRPCDALWAEDALAVALGSVADVAVSARPRNAAEWRHAARPADGESSNLIVLDQLASAAAHEDSTTWQSEIMALEANWFAPLSRDLRERRLASVTLIVPGEAACWRFEVRPADFLKFWRSARPWAEYS